MFCSIFRVVSYFTLSENLLITQRCSQLYNVHCTSQLYDGAQLPDQVSSLTALLDSVSQNVFLPTYMLHLITLQLGWWSCSMGVIWMASYQSSNLILISIQCATFQWTLQVRLCCVLGVITWSHTVYSRHNLSILEVIMQEMEGNQRWIEEYHWVYRA